MNIKILQGNRLNTSKINLKGFKIKSNNNYLGTVFEAQQTTYNQNKVYSQIRIRVGITTAISLVQR